MSRLAILICTLPERYEKLSVLLDILNPQIEKFNDRVFIRLHDAGRSMTTGEKRNRLIEESDSDYFTFIDDDDFVTPDYIEQIVNAMDQNPDVITFCGWITTNGRHRTHWEIKLGNKYEERNGVYYRFPNHLAVMKRELVRGVKFPDVWQQEDFLWARQIHERKLLKTEIHIPEELYHYQFDDRKPSYARRSEIR